MSASATHVYLRLLLECFQNWSLFGSATHANCRSGGDKGISEEEAEVEAGVCAGEERRVYIYKTCEAEQEEGIFRLSSCLF